MLILSVQNIKILHFLYPLKWVSTLRCFEHFLIYFLALMHLWGNSFSSTTRDQVFHFKGYIVNLHRYCTEIGIINCYLYWALVFMLCSVLQNVYYTWYNMCTLYLFINVFEAQSIISCDRRNKNSLLVKLILTKTGWDEVFEAPSIWD